MDEAVFRESGDADAPAAAEEEENNDDMRDDTAAAEAPTSSNSSPTALPPPAVPGRTAAQLNTEARAAEVADSE